KLGIGVDAEIGASDVGHRLRATPERLQGVEDAGSKAALLRERTQGGAVLGAAQVDGRLSRGRTERVDHVGGQLKDDVVRNGQDGQVGDIDRRCRALAGSGTELLGEIADVVGVAAADRGDGVAGRMKGAPQGRSGPAGSDDRYGRFLHDSVSVAKGSKRRLYLITRSRGRPCESARRRAGAS